MYMHVVMSVSASLYQLGKQISLRDKHIKSKAGCTAWCVCPNSISYNHSENTQSGRFPVNPWPQTQLVGGYGGHLVAFLQYGVAVCPCVLQEGSYDGHERKMSLEDTDMNILGRFSGSDVSSTKVDDLITSVATLRSIQDLTVWPFKT